jgi:peptidoglycan/xylan/chitin deacetylase (PgdA/CDA1 family)
MLALLVAGLGIPLAASTFLPVRGVHDWLVPGAIWRLPGSLHLTFDDGPDTERTPRVLDLLAAFGVRATFFLLGERVARATPLVRRIASEGHSIGNHGWDHATLSFASRRKICEQLNRSQDAIGSVLGERPTLFRPPFGRRDYRLYQETRRRGLTTMLWSLDSGDWLGISPARIARRVSKAVSGDIVLLHDGNPRATGTIVALSTILSHHQASVPPRTSAGALA